MKLLRMIFTVLGDVIGFLCIFAFAYGFWLIGDSVGGMVP